MAGGSPFTNTLRKLRFDHGEMTQEELAAKVGVTRQTVIALEANKYVPSLLLASKLARVFGARLEDVFRLADDQEGATHGPR